MTRSVFISSTSLDLRDHRAAVDAAIRRLEQRPINMDDFGSQPGGAAGVSLREVGKADVFIGILARRYGYIPAGMDTSVTEQEYDEAVKRGLPRLMYLVDPAHDWDWPSKSDPANLEDAAKQAKLAAFKARVEASEVRTLFTTPDNVAQQVTADLTKLLDKQRRAQMFTRALIAVVVMVALIALGTAFSQQITPTNTDSVPSISLPTSLARTPCMNEEMCVVVAEFTGERGSDQQINIVEVLNEAAREVGNVSVIPIGHPIANRDEAQGIGAIYNATLVIYGRVVAGGITTSYEITRDRNEIATQIEGSFRIDAEHVENFDVFLYKGADSRYVMHFTKGQLHYWKEEYSAALHEFENALEFLPSDRQSEYNAGGLYLNRGYCLMKLRREFEAIEAFSEAIRARPDLAPAYLNRGVAIQLSLLKGTSYITQEDLLGALEDYNRAIDINPTYAIAFNNRGLIHESLNSDFEAALLDYSRAIALNPDMPSAHFNRGRLYLRQQRLEEAIQDFTQTIEADESFLVAYSLRGLALSIQGEQSKSLDDFNIVIQGEANVIEGFLADNLSAELLEQMLVLDPCPNCYVFPEFYRYMMFAANFSHIRIAIGGRANIYYDMKRFDDAISDYRTYERLTGQLEPLMVTRIAEMEAALGTPTAVATP